MAFFSKILMMKKLIRKIKIVVMSKLLLPKSRIHKVQLQIFIKRRAQRRSPYLEMMMMKTKRLLIKEFKFKLLLLLVKLIQIL